MVLLALRVIPSLRPFNCFFVYNVERSDSEDTFSSYRSFHITYNAFHNSPIQQGHDRSQPSSLSDLLPKLAFFYCTCQSLSSGIAEVIAARYLPL